jgi:hypothetical protein
MKKSLIKTAFVLTFLELGLFSFFGMNDIPPSSEIYNSQIEHAQTSKVTYTPKTKQQTNYLIQHRFDRTEEELIDWFNQYKLNLPNSNN